MNLSGACGSLLIIGAAIFMHFAKNRGGTFFVCSILLHISARCLFFLYATPFFCGVFLDKLAANVSCNLASTLRTRMKCIRPHC